MQITDSLFINNRALPVDSSEIKALEDASQRYTPLSFEHERAPNYSRHLGNFSLLEYITNAKEGFGGGIGVSFLDVQLFTAVEVIFGNLLLMENEAVVGGTFLCKETTFLHRSLQVLLLRS